MKNFIKSWKRYGPGILLLTAGFQFLAKEWAIGTLFLVLAVNLFVDDEE
jgi:hypothetical protein